MTMPEVHEQDLRLKVLWGRWGEDAALQQLCIFRHNHDPQVKQPIAMMLVPVDLDEEEKEGVVREFLQTFANANGVSMMAVNFNDILCLGQNDPRLKTVRAAMPVAPTEETIARLAQAAGVSPNELAALQGVKPTMTPYAGIHDRTRRRRAGPAEDAPRRRGGG